MSSAATDSSSKENECKDDPCPQCAFQIPCKHCCIYRVAKKLHNIDKEADTPQAVVIGPFNSSLRVGCPNLEKLKKRYLVSFCKRARTKETDLTEFIKERIDKIRYCYSEGFDPGNNDAESFDLDNNDKFAELIGLDAVFIIELFWRYHCWTTQDHGGEECPEVPYDL